MSVSASPLVRIDGISYQYRNAKQPSLNGISLQIKTGQILGLLGPNGAGKTTLISLIAGLLPVQTGGITLGGVPLFLARKAQPTSIALVPQENAVYPMLSVLENLRFFAGVQAIPRADQAGRIEEAVHFCRLESVTQKLAAQLSGGLRRRLNLAIGLLCAPQLLLLDEPTVGVDPQSRHFLLDSITELRRQGMSVLYTSHYMNEIEAICDDVAIIDHGKVISQGTLGDLVSSHSSHLDLSLKAPLSPEQLADLAFDLKETSFGRYQGVVPDRGLRTLLDQLAQQDNEILAISYGRQNLEQIFMRLTQSSLRD